MLRRWAMRRREDALHRYEKSRRLSHLLNGSPVARHADHFTAKHRRQLRRADLLLDALTLNGRI